MVVVDYADGVEAEDYENNYPRLFISGFWKYKGVRCARRTYGSRKKNAIHNATFRRRYM